MKEVKFEVLEKIELTQEELNEIEEFQKDLGNGGQSGSAIFCSCMS